MWPYRFTNNIYVTKDHTYHNLRGMIKIKTLYLLKKISSSEVIIKKSDYVTKLDILIEDGVMKSTYIETTGNMLKEISRFQDILYRNFYNYESYKSMKPDSNQTARLYGQLKPTNLKI